MSEPDVVGDLLELRSGVFALLQQDPDTKEAFYLSTLSGLENHEDWLDEWVDDIDGALLLPWSQMVALACAIKAGDAELVPVIDES